MNYSIIIVLWVTLCCIGSSGSSGSSSKTSKTSKVSKTSKGKSSSSSSSSSSSHHHTVCSPNYILIVDESGSVSKTNFENTYDFIINDLVGVGGVGGAINSESHIGAFSYSTGVDDVYNIAGEQHDGRAELIAALQDERADRSGGFTHTALALQHAVDMFNDAGITTHRRIILFTDGIPILPGGNTIVPNPCQNDVALLAELAGIDILFVMIDGFNINPLACLFEPGNANVIETVGTDFTIPPLADIISEQDECANHDHCMYSCGHSSSNSHSHSHGHGHGHGHSLTVVNENAYGTVDLDTDLDIEEINRLDAAQSVAVSNDANNAGDAATAANEHNNSPDMFGIKNAKPSETYGILSVIIIASIVAFGFIVFAIYQYILKRKAIGDAYKSSAVTEEI